MNNINIFNHIITIVSFIANVIFIIPLIFNVYNYFTNKIYLRKVLNFIKEPIHISSSVFELITDEGNKNNFITYLSLKAISNVINLLNTLNYKFELINTSVNTNNEINIGGFMTNKKVNAYFTKYFNNFKFVTNIKYKNIYDKYPIDKRMVEYSSDKFGFKVNDNIFLETKSKIIDYAFLVKLTENDFKDGTTKSVHILFGGGEIGTLKATEYLLVNYKQIYKKYKNNHYFFAIEINRIDESINYSKGIIDLTDVMFQSNNP